MAATPFTRRSGFAMPLSLRESQVVEQFADLLYDFLPGTPHPYASSDLSFPGAARAAGVAAAWPDGSKRPAIVALLTSTLERERKRFCPLIVEIVRRAMTYRATKNSLTREDVDRVNALLLQLQFKVPDLLAPEFLDSLPRQTRAEAAPATAVIDRERLVGELTALHVMAPHPRGIAFEAFLKNLFSEFGLAPRSSFTLRGEQIDGSFALDASSYLVEAKWRSERTGNRDLAAFNDQVGARAEWARGLFVSYAGFTDDGIAAFTRGRRTRIICADSMDLYYVLIGGIDLADALRAKARRAVEDGQAFAPITDLFPRR